MVLTERSKDYAVTLSAVTVQILRGFINCENLKKKNYQTAKQWKNFVIKRDWEKKLEITGIVTDGQLINR